eukprot:5853082-Pyramimonas_sp.AAC.1
MVSRTPNLSTPVGEIPFGTRREQRTVSRPVGPGHAGGDRERSKSLQARFLITTLGIREQEPASRFISRRRTAH